VQFVGDFTIDPTVCDRLVELHRACDHKALVKRGSMGKAGTVVVNVEKKDSFDVAVSAIPEAMQDEFGMPAYFGEL